MTSGSILQRATARLFCAAAMLGGAHLGMAANTPPPMELAQVRTVYVLSMSNGLDQYIANHLARGGRFQIVTDAQIADAILTDRIGESFEGKLNQIYPVAESSDSDTDTTTMRRRAGDDLPMRISSFNRSRGNMFLVDRRTRAVIWSDFRRARNSQPEEVDRLGEYFASRLKKTAGKYVAGMADNTAAPLQPAAVVVRDASPAQRSTPAAERPASSPESVRDSSQPAPR